MTPPRDVRVLLASPLPPPDGGIAGWTARMLVEPVAPGIRRAHVDTATRLLHHYAAPVGAQRIWRQAAVVARFLRGLIAFRPDVVHITTSYDTAFLRDGLFIVFARLAGAAPILNIRGGDFARFHAGCTPRAQRLIDRVLRLCAAVVPVTGETRAFLESRGIAHVIVVPNCVDLLPAPPRRVDDIRRWIFVGWVMPAKGIPELLEALAAFPDATLTIAGPSVVQDGVDGAVFLAAESERLGIADRVRHLGALTHAQVRALYREHDLLVFPTRREGFPNVVLEAMEAGLPIVATTVGAIPEMIRDDIDGLLVPARNAAALVTAIRRVTESPELARRLGASARARVVEAFTVARISVEWCTLYTRLARDPRTGKTLSAPEAARVAAASPARGDAHDG